MARNRFLAHERALRAKRRDARREVRGEDVLAGLRAGGDTPSQLAAARDLYDRVRAGMTPAERELADRVAAGQGWAEIAAAYGESPDAVRMRHQRTLARFRELLDEPE
jgi:hypothetical protein